MVFDPSRGEDMAMSLPKPLTVGVFGSAKEIPAAIATITYRLGEVLAYHGAITLTGACPGVSAATVAGAKSQSGRTLGVSPAANREEHTERYGLPTEGLDTIVYTGAGFKGRNVIAVRSSDICIIVRGGIGTLNEFTIALDEGKVIGVVAETGGTADLIPYILDHLAITDTARGKLYFETDVEKLVVQLL